jgi:hypothetical protein
MSKTYKYILQPGQNLADVAMQEYGSIDALLQLCIDNGLEIGQEVLPGIELVLNESNKIDKRLIEQYKSIEYKVAGGNKPTEIESPWILGKGFWNDDKIWIDEEQWKDN